MREWDIEFLDRTQSLYPARTPSPVRANTEQNTQQPNIVPIVTYKFGFIGRLFDIVRTKY